MLKLYNSLTRTVEEFKPKNPNSVKVYTCGPTVYDFVTIGNWRTYVFGDLVIRTLKYFGFKPKYIMNITDVGHLSGDNLGDADTGIDRMEKGSEREKKTAWEIADFYIKDFFNGFEKLNLTKPYKFTRATDYIKEQIDLVQKIEKKGFAYKIADGIYFDVKAYEKAGFNYDELTTLDQRKSGTRVKENIEKKDPRDFALWKFSPKKKQRQMEWESPWGKGFPGWHVECSAMSMKYLGNQLDVHIGGEDLRSTHHPNETAQSQSVTDLVPFSRFWLHGAFLLVNGSRMGKSLGNAYTQHDLSQKGFDLLALKYFYFTGHYRKQLNFTWQALESSAMSFSEIYSEILFFPNHQNPQPDDKKLEIKFKNDFKSALADDLNMPKVLAVVWKMIKSNLNQAGKIRLLLEFDQVLGFNLKSINIPPVIQALLKERDKCRSQNDWPASDKLRKQIKELGYSLEDTPFGTKLKV